LADHVIIINHGVKVYDDTLKNLQQNLGEPKTVTITVEKPMEEIITNIYNGSKKSTH